MFISVEGLSGLEARDDPEFVVSLSEPSASAVTVDYRTLSGTAIEGVDFNGTDGTLVFAPGETSKTVIVRDRFDRDDETDEALVLELFDPVNASLADGVPVLRHTAWVLDDDGVGPNLALFVSNPVIVEGDAGARQAVFDISLSQSAPRAFTLNYATADGSARAGQDYVGKRGEISFAPGQKSATVTIDVLGDGAVEPTETFALVVTPAGPIASAAAGAAGEATILADDARREPVISTAPVQASEERADPEFVLTLSRPSTQAVTVEYRTLSGTATEGQDFNRAAGTVTFAPGETSKTVIVRDRFDRVDEVDEALILELFDPVNASLANDAAVLRQTGWILDNDGVGPNLALFVSNPVIAEGDAGTRQAVFDVSLSQPAPRALSLAFATADGSAIAGQDYVPRSGQIAFAAGQQTTSVAVDVLGDVLGAPFDQANESFFLVVTATAPIASGAAGSTGAATIVGPDPRSIVGGDTAETLRGTASSEAMLGLAGNDLMFGFGGSDLMQGGAGSDTIYGGNGPDTLLGQTGNDVLAGENFDAGRDPFAGQVYRLYQATLDRAPDLGGLLGWVDYLKGGQPLTNAAAGFVRSAEFQSTYGATSNAQFVTLLYDNVLDRGPDPGGFNSWMGALARGASRADLVVGFSESAEFRTKTTAGSLQFSDAATAADWGDDVFRLYQATLDRTPDVGGLLGWIGYLNGGQPFTNAAAAFVASPEFQATYGVTTTTQFVTLLYNNVLDRNPDAAGQAAWVNALSGGLSRAEVVAAFAQSAEFKAKSAPEYAEWMRGLADQGDVLAGGPGSDILFGGLFPDTFQFRAADGGTDRIVDLEPWDRVVLDGFRFATPAQAKAALVQNASDAVLTDGANQIHLLDTAITDISADIFVIA